MLVPTAMPNANPNPTEPARMSRILPMRIIEADAQNVP
jgi:hypothetical protein